MAGQKMRKYRRKMQNLKRRVEEITGQTTVLQQNQQMPNCAGDHRTRDCQNRQQPQTPSISNPANGPGIYKNSPVSQ